MSLDDFTRLVLPVKNKLYRFALKFMGNREEAEDIIQEVLLKLWNQKEKLGTYLDFDAWCMRMVKNQSLDRLKSAQYKAKMVDPAVEIAAGDRTPYQKTEMESSISKVRQLIDSLPEKQKQIIHLRDVEGFTYQEIADIMEIDLTNVKVYLFRARNTVKTKLLNVEAYGTK